jgi:hypothetical protein
MTKKTLNDSKTQTLKNSNMIGAIFLKDNETTRTLFLTPKVVRKYVVSRNNVFLNKEKEGFVPNQFSLPSSRFVPIKLNSRILKMIDEVNCPATLHQTEETQYVAKSGFYGVENIVANRMRTGPHKGNIRLKWGENDPLSFGRTVNFIMQMIARHNQGGNIQQIGEPCVYVKTVSGIDIDDFIEKYEHLNITHFD